MPETSDRGVRCCAAHFLHQHKSECRYANRTRGEVRYLLRYIYDRHEFVRFDSCHGDFEAVTELGQPFARYFNSQKEVLDSLRSAVESFCCHNYGVFVHGRAIGRTVVPTVTISPTKGDPLAHHTLLICTAAGYYPQGVNIKWLKNGQEQTAGVGYAEELQNADWAYQYQAMLETVPQRGDLYACQVEHSSQKEPITVQWGQSCASRKAWLKGRERPDARRCQNLTLPMTGTREAKQVAPPVAADARCQGLVTAVCAVVEGAPHIYDRQEFLRFDSRRGDYEALTELGQPTARYFNSKKGWMDYERGQVDALCRLYEALTELGQPTARYFNSKKGWMDYERGQVDALCRLNYGVFVRGRAIGRT
ncbi:PREDICTED: H-2 class II histocompatibility antigen, I-E beta chain-like, partial [Gekko japonicus]|uniref:H-2 class II histocompatibility antigen, I-E beta chain-like n=1 Tax=Gekko japonicus TaxID=146911 RepID=A0ABM1KXF8_GEKJA